MFILLSDLFSGFRPTNKVLSGIGVLFRLLSRFNRYWHCTVLGKTHRIRQLAFFPLLEGLTIVHPIYCTQFVLSVIIGRTIALRRKLRCTVAHVTNSHSRLKNGSTATAERHASYFRSDLGILFIGWEFTPCGASGDECVKAQRCMCGNVQNIGAATITMGFLISQRPIFAIMRTTALAYHPAENILQGIRLACSRP
jgi:hypothetical protein